MKIFVSHKSEDVAPAKKLAGKLKTLGFDIYLDAYDEQIKIAKDRPNHIQEQIGNSTDLLVVITGNTQTSWWVPFEIGLSTALDKRIASLIFKGAGDLPSFLRKWPVIDNNRKWEIYLEELRKNRLELLNERKNLNTWSDKRYYDGRAEENFSAYDNIRTSDLFHSVLMSRFRQEV